jgi:predicted MFS family arabinose efflux permease
LTAGAASLRDNSGSTVYGHCLAGVCLPSSPRQILALAFALSLGAAISLGITRFAYGLLLPFMRADLSWSYTLAGAMNTVNALGYFVGALLTPTLMRRFGPSAVLSAGAVLAGAFMVLSGFFTDAPLLLVQRLCAGIASALVFIAGGLLAARLGARDPQRAGLLLGVYYGGTGFGIVLSSLLVPIVLAATSTQLHSWRFAWWALGGVCLLATVVLVWAARVMAHWVMSAATSVGKPDVFRWRSFGFGLAGYSFFGVGYIGYMTFVVALLRTQGRSDVEVTVFYGLLGIAVVASSRVWASLLDRYKDGRPLAVLNGLLGVATLIPALTQSWPLVLLSGVLFGGVFLSVVAASTALVRHNLPQSAWAAGIGAFTAVFAAGQIVGPTVVGLIADGVGGLEQGLVFSALALWLSAALVSRQRSMV